MMKKVDIQFRPHFPYSHFSQHFQICTIKFSKYRLNLLPDSEAFFTKSGNIKRASIPPSDGTWN